MFLPSHLHTGSGSDQKVPALTDSGSGSATLLFAGGLFWVPTSFNVDIFIGIDILCITSRYVSVEKLFLVPDHAAEGSVQ